MYRILHKIFSYFSSQSSSLEPTICETTGLPGSLLFPSEALRTSSFDEVQQLLNYSLLIVK